MVNRIYDKIFLVIVIFLVAFYSDP